MSDNSGIVLPVAHPGDLHGKISWYFGGNYTTTVAHPALKSSRVVPSTDSEIDLPPCAVGVVQHLDAETIQIWGRSLLVSGGAGGLCTYCSSGCHARGGWHPFRSVSVKFGNCATDCTRCARVEHYFCKAGDIHQGRAAFDVVQTGDVLHPLVLSWEMLVQEAVQVEAVMEAAAKNLGLSDEVVQEIADCEAQFGHSLPLQCSRDLKRSWSFFRRPIWRAARQRVFAWRLRHGQDE